MANSSTRSASSLSDRDLVLRYRSGDQDAFGALMERHNGGVTRVLAFHLAPSLRYCRDSFEDVRADVWKRVIGALHTSFDPSREFRAYLWQVARSACYEANKARRRENERYVSLYDPVDGRSLEERLDALDSRPRPMTSREAAERAEASVHVQGLLAALPPGQRKVVEMHHLQNLPVRQIAAREGLNAECVKTRLRRAMATLRKHCRPDIATARRPAPPGGRGRGARSRARRTAVRPITADRRFSRPGTGVIHPAAVRRGYAVLACAARGRVMGAV